MSKRFAAPLLLSIFAVSCGNQTQLGNDLQARGSNGSPITIAAPATAKTPAQPGSLMKCLTVSGWELEVAIKDSKTLVLNYTFEGDSMFGTLQAKQSIELVRAKMHSDLGLGSRNAYGVSRVSKVIGAKGPMLTSGTKKQQSVADFLKSTNISQIELSSEVDASKEVTSAKAMIVATLADAQISRVTTDALTCADRPEKFLDATIAK